jgi:nucleoside-diphosphate-sugar epimerase
MKPSEVLVTGGTGTLSLRVVKRLLFEGREVRLMSRGGQPGTVKGDLLTGEGVEEAVLFRHQGLEVQTILSCASMPC